MSHGPKLRRAVLVFLVVCAAFMAHAQWKPVGPEGGDARSLTYDPRNPDRILLGTSAGHIFQSQNGGRSWSQWVHFGTRDDLVLDTVAFDPANSNTIYVAAWSVEEPSGDLFRSRDSGKTWQALPGVHGKSIRAFALAESDPRILVIGALDGVFRSRDAGDTWERITPAGHADLRNFESVAIDRVDPNVIYAGTWHLPWKTSDGGKSWRNIKTGIIDDSDVFSIIIDHSNPKNVFTSACSGIYKSENAGELFRKIQGIPGSARRTRVLQQDPVNANVVYAGTTEGLWKTVDSGKTFKLISPPNYILNDVMVDPRNPNRVLIATDRGGVFSSDNGGQTFLTSNAGFSHRQVTALVPDQGSAGTLWVSMVNDKEFGGVFVSRDYGQNWAQMNSGLEHRDIFDLGQAPGGTLLAATNHGLYTLAPGARQWAAANTIITAKPQPQPKAVRVKGKLVQPKPLPPLITKSELQSRAANVSVGEKAWFAATDVGILASTDQGKSWTRAAIPGETRFTSIAHSGTVVAASTPSAMALSLDSGAQWQWAKVPQWVTRIYGLAADGDNLWMSTREGALVSRDKGATWEHVLSGLPARDVVSIHRAPDGTLLATAAGTNRVYTSRNRGASWTETPRSTYALQHAVSYGGRIFAASAFNGVFASEPQSGGGSAISSVGQPGMGQANFK